MNTQNNNPDFNIVFFEMRFRETLYKYTLALHYLTAVLRENNFTVYDYIFENETVDKICETLLMHQPKIVGIHFYRENAEDIFLIIRKIKAHDPNIKILLGGHTATLYPVMVMKLEPLIDVVVYGEGELTIVDLCRRIKNNQSLENCKGIVYRQHHLIMRNEPRELITDLDQLPLPAVDVLKNTADIKRQTVFSAIASSRGCLGRCSFCISNRTAYSHNNYEWRGRTPQNVIQEIELLINTFPDKRVVTRFVDGSFEDPDPAFKKRMISLLDLIEERKLKFAFTILTRAESWTENDIPLIKRLKRLGLYEVAIGFEGSTPHSLKILNKKAALDDNIRAKRLFSENGVFVFGFLIMFHPYAMYEELYQNAKFLKEMSMAYQPQCWWSELDLYPDARLFQYIVNDGLLMGTDDGFLYQFAFVDGRVDIMHKTLNRIRDVKNNLEYRESIEKIKLELLLYEVWKNQYGNMKLIENEIAEYNQLFLDNCNSVGNQQYEYFIALMESVNKNQDSPVINEIINDWNNMLEQNHIYLEKEWVKFRMLFGRKRVFLI